MKAPIGVVSMTLRITSAAGETREVEMIGTLTENTEDLENVSDSLDTSAECSNRRGDCASG